MDKDDTRRKILIIDDELDLLTVVQALFEGKGYQAFGASNAADGIRLNKRENPDVIILDLRMPEMDGIETLRQIRKKDDQVKVVILTGYESPDTIKDTADLNVSAYIRKPFENDQLVRIIGEALRP